MKIQISSRNFRLQNVKKRSCQLNTPHFTQVPSSRSHGNSITFLISIVPGDIVDVKSEIVNLYSKKGRKKKEANGSAHSCKRTRGKQRRRERETFLQLADAQGSDVYITGKGFKCGS